MPSHCRGLGSGERSGAWLEFRAAGRHGSLEHPSPSGVLVYAVLKEVREPALALVFRYIVCGLERLDDGVVIFEELTDHAGVIKNFSRETDRCRRYDFVKRLRCVCVERAKPFRQFVNGAVKVFGDLYEDLHGAVKVFV
mgnify:CR=1 FL=1